ncbi:MAG: hypothetical protein GX267_11705 [Fibrobacter sp.]|jgi:hypothetical protein|nr:hypothetical protein [Fibrobacter sp.]
MHFDNLLFLTTGCVKKDKDQCTLECDLGTDQFVFMKDHFFAGNCLLPGAVMLELLVETCSVINDNRNFPLLIDEFEIFRTISVPVGKSTKIEVTAFKTDSGTFFAELRADALNADGKVVRKSKIVANAKIRFGIGDDRNNFKDLIFDATDGCKFSLGQDRFYQTFVKTHGELFRSLTGNFWLSEDRMKLTCEFSIGNKENHYHISEKNLSFLVSPLGIDSMLQMAVTCSVLNPISDQTYFFTKLPVRIDNLSIIEPICQHVAYFAEGIITDNAEDTLLVRGTIRSVDTGSFIAKANKITLKKAPFEKMSKESIDAALKKIQK